MQRALLLKFYQFQSAEKYSKVYHFSPNWKQKPIFRKFLLGKSFSDERELYARPVIPFCNLKIWSNKLTKQDRQKSAPLETQKAQSFKEIFSMAFRKLS